MHTFWNFIKKMHPTIAQSKYTIITNQDKGSLSAMEEIFPLAGRFLCSFHCLQNIMKKCSGETGQRPMSAMWMYNLLMGCKSVASLSATRKQYKEKMYPTDRHYLFNIAEEIHAPLGARAYPIILSKYFLSVRPSVRPSVRACVRLSPYRLA